MSEQGLAVPFCPFPREGPWPYLQGEGTQCRDGHQCCHEEGDHVADGGESHAGSRALQALARSFLWGQREGVTRGAVGRQKGTGEPPGQPGALLLTLKGTCWLVSVKA